MTRHPAFSFRRVLAALFWLALLAPASPVLADGKYYAREAKVGPSVPYQRAMISFNGEREILVVQSQYKNRGQTPLRDLGWIIPLPTVPEVGTMEPYRAERLFSRLGMKSSIRYVSISDRLMAWLTFAIMIGLGAMLLRLLAAFAVVLFKLKPDPLIGTPRGNLKLVGLTFLGMLLAMIATPQFSSYGPNGKGAVDVVKAQTVGGLDFKVVKSGDAAALLSWFTQHGLNYDPTDIAAIERHVAKGWVFVTARASATAEAAELVSHNGMLAPLVLVFPTRKMVYPLALTATIGQNTAIELFVYNEGKVDSAGRLPLKFAGVDPEGADWFAEHVQPPGLLANEKITANYLTRFLGEMTAEQMKDDLILVPAADNVPIKLTEYHW